MLSLQQILANKTGKDTKHETLRNIENKTEGSIPINSEDIQSTFIPLSFASEDTSSLLAYIILISKSNTEDTYVNYMGGARELAAWLGPFSNLSHLPYKTPSFFLRTYELNNLGSILDIHPHRLIRIVEQALVLINKAQGTRK